MSLKNALLISATALSITITTSSLAEYGLPEESTPAKINSWYLDLTGGAGFPPNTTIDDITTTYHVGYDAGVAAGYRGGPLRYELQYLYQNSSIDTVGGLDLDGNVRLHSGMLNVYYEFGDPVAAYSPFLGAGIGYSHISQTDRESDGRFSYQAIAGIGFNVLQNFTFTLHYSYFGTSTAEDTLGQRFQNHLVNAGLIYYIE